MADGGAGALSVEIVMQRFAEAEALLDQAAGRVDAVALAAETSQSSTAALADAASAIGDAAAQHRASIVAVQEALVISARSLEVASTFLANTDVSRLTLTVADLVERIGLLEQALAAGRQGTDAKSDRLSALVESLASRVDATQQMASQRDAAVARLNQVMDAVPARLRKRLGAKH
jgi:hypothetical protein